MMPDDTEAAILSALARFGAFVHARDMAIMSEFSSEPGVRLIGSEIRDICDGRDAIAAHMRLIFDMPLKLEFKWERRDVAHSGDIAWLFADGEALFHRDDGEVARVPYRLTG